MPEFPPLPLPDTPRLAQNITHFARALRRAGLPIGPSRVAQAVAAVAEAGVSSRRDFYWTLHACLVSKPEHRTVFAQIFRLYWRDPRFLEHMMAAMLPAIRGTQEQQAAKPAQKRAAEALLDGATDPDVAPQEADAPMELQLDATQTMSDQERLRQLDFEQMSTAEVAEAKRMLSQMHLPIQPLNSRRLVPTAGGRRADWRRTLQQAARRGGDVAAMARSDRRLRWPNLVVICDISGSMSQYSRLILHFLHAVANRKGPGWARVHGFTFGTRLTNITRHLAQRDVDAALAAAGAEAQDWEGGTRIGACLHRFNRDWSRRVMGQGAVVLLITDGLDRDDPAQLSAEIQRLQLASRQLIWLNPLLRFDGFAPKASGIRAMLPHVDSFRAGHSISALQDLADALRTGTDQSEKQRLMELLNEDPA
ncbi:VWA domain-containing protein [Phaeobacter sp.]|uniref:vWA domain-containing protein n=1 Tax=Phaeobacter sp. TaxID=1902409 RepID=UPI0025E33C2F|nr:VWA domain-containing protein [Phaeobacter sp.]